jgi:hypothetical protein
MRFHAIFAICALGLTTATLSALPRSHNQQPAPQPVRPEPDAKPVRFLTPAGLRPVVKDLNLNQEQRKAVEEILTRANARQAELTKQMRDGGEPVDPNALTQLSQDTLSDIRALLDADQSLQLDERMDRSFRASSLRSIAIEYSAEDRDEHGFVREPGRIVDLLHVSEIAISRIHLSPQQDNRISELLRELFKNHAEAHKESEKNPTGALDRMRALNIEFYDDLRMLLMPEQFDEYNEHLNSVRRKFVEDRRPATQPGR